MIIDITNEVLTKLKTDLTGVEVVTSFQSGPKTPSFPRLVFTEGSNISHPDTIDSGGEKYNDLSFEVNIFTKGSKKMSDAKTVRNNVDAIMSDHYGMERTFSDVVENYSDTSIYRYILRYTCLVDTNETIYRR